MGLKKKTRKKNEESGIALLLSIFVLLLVCVVGIAMLAASGSETSLTGNYRSSTAVYYAAISGLEEGRGRLLPRNPNYLGPYLPPPGSTLAPGRVIYIKNPLPGDPLTTIDPLNLGNPSTFPDTHYQLEFPMQNPPSNVQYPSSAATITNPANSPNPLYKWVRINALTEYALQIDVNCSSGGGCSGGSFNKTAPIYFDGTNLTRTTTQYQALGITALAALPDGSRKLLQYVVAPTALKVPVAAALTLAGPGTVFFVSFNPPASANSFYVNGNDQSGSGGLVCTPQPALPGVGVYNLGDYNSVNGSLSSPPPKAVHYTGAGGTTPNVSPSPYVHPSNSTVDMTDPVSLSNFVITVQNAADSVITGPATGSDMPAGMSFSSPMTVVVNGDLTLNGYTGYGLLVVTGTLNYSGDSGWKGLVLVIGQGAMNETGSAADTGEFDGAVFVANTTGGGGGGGGISLGPASYTISGSGGGGKGIYYDSCWIANSLKPISYKVVSFHEIPYP